MILTNLPLEVTPELVIRAQGLVYDLVKTKSPKLIAITEKAIEIGSTVLEPKVVYERYAINGYSVAGILLENGEILESELIRNYLATSQSVVAAVCTVGSKIDEFTYQTFKNNPGLGMALEAFASVATEILGNSFCNYVDNLVSPENLYTSLPINPGVTGWPVEEGQPQLFDLVDPSAIGVKLDSSGLIKPLKSLSMMIGISQIPTDHQKSCDLCNLQKTCLYKPESIN